MATGSNTKKPCCKCNKGGATFTCDGCHQSFCLKHASDHREELSQQMDNIGQQHDILKRDVDQQNMNKTLLAEIDRWEKESIEKIRSNAEKARADLKRLAEDSKTRLNILLGKLSNELRSYQENDEYTEEDLGRWMNQLKELRKEVDEPSEIDLVEDIGSSVSLIKVKNSSGNEKSSIDSSQMKMRAVAEKFNEIAGSIVLSKNYCFATCRSIGDDKYASVCGYVQYLDGVYILRFRLTTNRDSQVFFGIMNRSQSIVKRSSVLEYVYGFWSDGSSLRAGPHIRTCEQIEIQPDDIVILILNCSSRKLTYVHERTQMRYEMKVEQKICPLPWKLVITMWRSNDQVEILN